MGNVFKKEKITKITKQDKAVLQLKQQRDRLRQYQRRIETSLENDRHVAKTLITDGKKDRALLLLRKKRYQETLLNNADNLIQNIEQLASDIEFAQVETEVVQGLKMGNKALQDINATMNIDDITQMLEETKEAFEMQEEINALLSGVLTNEDEDAVLEELDKMVKEEVDLLPVPASGDVEADEGVEEDEAEPELPAVPTDKIRIKESVKDTAETRQLEAPLES